MLHVRESCNSWCAVGMGNEPPPTPLIEDLALVSDCHMAALVSRDLQVVWMCSPRFDSPSVFGSLLDPEAGHSGISVSGVVHSERRYVEDTLVVQTGPGDLGDPRGAAPLPAL
jgi:hypothetical protein